MIGLDTNVLVRYIMQDDDKQSPKANALMDSLDVDHPGFVTMVSVLELYWVLTSCYELTGQEVKKALEALLRVKQIVVDRADLVLRALRAFGAAAAGSGRCRSPGSRGGLRPARSGACRPETRRDRPAA